MSFRNRLWAALALASLLLAALPLLSAGTEDEQPPPDKALLVVRLPEKAALTIGTYVTKQTGAERTFISPPLAPDKTYSYKLKGTWDENGKTKTVERRVAVAPGRRTVVDLTAAEPGAPAPAAAKSRTFLFTYAGAVTGLRPGDKARVWLPVPPTNDDQQVKVEAQDLPPGAKEGKDPQYGNTILYFEAAADKDGRVPFARTYRVTRREVKGPEKDRAGAALVQRFLEADRLVPVGGKPLEEIEGKLPGLKGKALPKDPTEAAKVLYDVVDQHMKYDKTGTGWGRGDARWACDSGKGNCTDFHSLFISLARANKVPAKFEMGFPLPEKRGAGAVPGYHCWAKFLAAGKGWVAVDISEANRHPDLKEYYFGNLTPDRVAFSEGRDITLAPKQDGEPLNYFVYPYAEAGGKPYPADKVEKKFSYKDVE